MSNEFGKYMKAKRLELDKTLRLFCKEYALDPVHISRLERGIEPPPGYPELNDLRGYLWLTAAEWQKFKELAVQGRGEWVKPYIANVIIWTNGMVSAFDGSGLQIELCQGFILSAADKLREFCDENTEWHFAKWDDWQEKADFSWWWGEGHDAKSQE